MGLMAARSRLSLRIYLIGLLQLVVAAMSIVLVHRLFEQSRAEHEARHAPGLVMAFGELIDQPETLQRALAQLKADRAIELTYYRADGERIASTDEVVPPLDDAQRAQLATTGAVPRQDGPPDKTTTVAILRDGKLAGYGRLRLTRDEHRRHAAAGRDKHHGHRPWFLAPIHEPAGVVLALMASAVIALLFARSLARPLARLARAAEAFGSGDLSARANIRRNDEIGSVARTFDEMAERVNALLRTQREFLANVSHELRTPLARIRVALDIAAEGDVESARESLAEITEDWTDLDRLVESLIAIARLDLAGDPTVPAAALREEPLDAVHLVERAAIGFAGMYPEHTLVVEHDEAALPMVGDGAMLRRVLDNVLGNAAKYSDPSAPIHLAVRQRGDDIEFTVSDRGIGIDAADLPRLFEPFFRADRSRTRKTGGAGLGLALARRIIDAHHGRISVASAVGAGTTVTFTVPSAPSVEA